MKTRFAILILVGILSQACSGPVTNSGRGSNNSNRGASGVVGGQSALPQSACQSDYMGWIYDDGSGQFASRLDSFVSVSLAPGNLGDVEATYGAASGVEVQMQAIFTQQGQFISQDAFLEIVINDSRVGEVDVTTGEAIEPYVVSLAQATAGSYNPATRQYQITYQDDYGRVIVEGAIQGSEFVGIIRFQNNVSWDGSSGQSGTLGMIRVPACSIVVQ
jgi:hypothetical protein